MELSMRECPNLDHGGSLLHCVVDYCPIRGSVSKQVFQTLVNNGVNKYALNRKGQSVICYALEKNNDAHTIQCLLDAGVRCHQHASLLNCATNLKCKILKYSVVLRLLRAGASPTEINSDGLMPLQSALLQCYCEKEAIALLLVSYNGVDLNSIVDDQRNGLLHLAAKNKQCAPSVWELLIQRGVKADNRNREGITAWELIQTRIFSYDNCEVNILKNKVEVSTEYPSICTAIVSGCSTDAIELLIAGGSLTNCPNLYHGVSVLHCAVVQGSTVSKEVFQTLVNNGANKYALNRKGQSVMCYALEKNSDAHTIQCLFDAGVRCHQHASLLNCATNLKCSILKSSVIEVLLRAGASPTEINSDGLLPLQSALLQCNCEKEAIALLLDCYNGVDLNSIVDDQRNGLLHLAVKNKQCASSVLDLLIQRGVKVDNRNRDGKTAWEVVQTMNFYFYDNGGVNILKFFIKNGVKVSTDIVAAAVAAGNDVQVLKILLNACTLLTKSFCQALLKSVSERYLSLSKSVILNFLMKFYFLKFSDYHMHFLYSRIIGLNQIRIKQHQSFFLYRQKLLKELVKMKSLKVGRHCTLHDYLISSPAANQGYDFNRLLNVLNESFPIYFDFILEKILSGDIRQQMEEKLEDWKVYFVKPTKSNDSVEKVLPFEATEKISQYLNDKDFLKFMMIFANVNGHASNAKRSKRRAEDPDIGEPDCKRCFVLRYGNDKSLVSFADDKAT